MKFDNFWSQKSKKRGSASRVAWSPNNKTVAIGYEKSVVVLKDLEKGAERLIYLTGQAKRMRYTRNSKYLIVTTCAPSVDFVDVETSQILRTRHFRDQVHYIRSASFGCTLIQQDGTLKLPGHLLTLGYTNVAMTDHPKRKIIVWAKSNNFVYMTNFEQPGGVSEESLFQVSMSFSASVTKLVFSPNGRWLAATNINSLIIYDFEKRTLMPRTNVRIHRINSVHFSPCSKWIVCTVDDGKIGIFRVQTGLFVRLYTHDKLMWDCVFSQKGSTLLQCFSDGRYHFQPLISTIAITLSIALSHLFPPYVLLSIIDYNLCMKNENRLEDEKEFQHTRKLQIINTIRSWKKRNCKRK